MTHVFIFMIRVYQSVRLFLGPPCCRFFPSCSFYSIEAFEKHGLIKGLYLSSIRVLKCGPWNRGGIDLVPEKINKNTDNS